MSGARMERIRTLISEAEIAARVEALAAEIAGGYFEGPPLRGGAAGFPAPGAASR